MEKQEARRPISRERTLSSNWETGGVRNLKVRPLGTGQAPQNTWVKWYSWQFFISIALMTVVVVHISLHKTAVGALGKLLSLSDPFCKY